MTDQSNPMIEIAKNSTLFAQFMSQWNLVELSARRIIQLMLGESELAMAITAEFATNNLVKSIKVATNDKQFLGVSEHLLWFAKGYDIIREYRNYYAHGIIGVLPDGIVLAAINGSSRLRFDNDIIPFSEIEKIVQSTEKLVGYGAAIEKELGATGPSIENLIASYGGDLTLNVWPEKIQKNSIFIH